MMKKTGFTKDEHAQVGQELIKIAVALDKIGGRLLAAYPVTSSQVLACNSAGKKIRDIRLALDLCEEQEAGRSGETFNPSYFKQGW